MDNKNELNERYAYNLILRGLIALIVFTLIVLAQYIYAGLVTSGLEYDDDKYYDPELNEYDSEPNESDSSCLGEDADARECFYEIKSGLIMAIVFQIIKFSIPLYGLVEVYRGVNIFYSLSAKKEIKIINKDGDNEFDIPISVTGIHEGKDVKMKVVPTVKGFDILIILGLLVATLYLLSTMTFSPF